MWQSHNTTNTQFGLSNYFLLFLTKDGFPLLLNQIKILNKYTLYGTQKIIGNLMNYCKAKSLKV